MMRRSKTQGFTLIEVLAAVAVLAIALSAVISGMARYADNASRLRDRTLAYMVAHNRLAQLELEPAWPAEGRSDGEVEMAGVRWRWEAEVKKTPDDALRRVDVQVMRAEDRSDEDGPLVTLSGFLASTGRTQ